MADNKNQEAEYFLDCIKATYLRPELRFNISAFLSATRSISDHLLEEYNVKVGLNIPLTKPLYPNVFEDVAQARSNQRAIQFITFFKQEFKKIEADPVGGFLINKRHINIHRTMNDAPLHANLNNTDGVGVGDSLVIKVFDLNGTLTNTIEGNPDPPAPAPPQSGS